MFETAVHFKLLLPKAIFVVAIEVNVCFFCVSKRQLMYV
jgi:hypothetical protein